MTAVTSTSKKSRFGVRFRTNFSEQRRYLIINSVLSLLGLPLIVLMGLFLSADDPDYDTCEPLMSVGVFAFCIAILSGIFIARNSFKYLYRKSLADMNYSLPLTSKQRFFADFLSGIVSYIAPIAISAVLSFIMLLVGAEFVSFDRDGFFDLMPYMLTAAFIILLGMILYYATVVFAVVCCGRAFESTFGAVAAVIMVPLLIYFVSLLIVLSADYGMDETIVFYNPLFTSTSPVGMAVFLVSFMEDADYTDYNGSAELWSGFVRWLIPSLIVIAAFIIGAFLLYSRRKAEDVSKPYPYKWFYYIITSMGIFVLLSLFVEFNTAVEAGILICAVIYFIIEVISNRGFKKLWLSAIRFAASVAAVFAIVNLCKYTDGFGMTEYVPSASSVSSVRIDTSSRNYDMMYIDYQCFDDREVIEEVVSAHKTIVDHRKSGTYPGTKNEPSWGIAVMEDNEMFIKYYKKNGTITVRQYSICESEIAGLKKAITLSDNYADKSAGVIRNYWERTESDYDRDIGNFDVYDIFGNMYSCSMSKSENDRLAEIYAADMKTLTPEQYDDGDIIGYICYRLPVYRSFENTIGFIEERQPGCFDVDAVNIFNNAGKILVCSDVYSCYVDYGSESDNLYDDTYDADNVHWYSDTLNYTSRGRLGYYETGFIPHYNTPDPDFAENLIDLMERAVEAGRPVAVNTEVSGVLLIDGYPLFFPKSEKNDELVAELEEFGFGMEKELVLTG